MDSDFGLNEKATQFEDIISEETDGYLILASSHLGQPISWCISFSAKHENAGGLLFIHNKAKGNLYRLHPS